MLASTPISHIQLRLPAGDVNTSFVNIIVQIRDILNCVTQFSIYSVIVVPDLAVVGTLVNVLQQSSTQAINKNPVIQLLSGGNQNTIAQVLTSFSQVFNVMNKQSVETAVASKTVNLFIPHDLKEMLR